MTTLEYLILTSMMPVGVLISAVLIVYFTREKPRRSPPGE